MDLKTALAAVPTLRRVWKWTPGPLRGPLVVVGVAVAVWYVATGRHREEDRSTG